MENKIANKTFIQKTNFYNRCTISASVEKNQYVN